MQKVLLKRVLRDLRANLLRYLALAFMIILGMYMIVSMVGAAENIMKGVAEQARKNQVEDGQFSMFSPLTKEDEKTIKQLGVTMEQQFSFDETLNDHSVLRLFKLRKKINLQAIESGRKPTKSDEIVLEKRYSEEKGLRLGDTITIGDLTFKITGIATSPDYDAPYNKLSDCSIDSSTFGVGWLTAEGYEKGKEASENGTSEEYLYAYQRTKDVTNQEVKDALKELQQNQLVSFVNAEDNARIKGSANDQVINKYAGMIAGVIIMILFTYVISVFVIHGIEKETSVIGALYALGAKKRDLLLHYLMLPALVTFVSGTIGTLLGFSSLGIDRQMVDCFRYFSVPQLTRIYPAYIFIYGIVMPPVVAIVVNLFVINKKLSANALSLIRNEQKSRHSFNLNLGSLGFVKRFQIRQMLREGRTAFTVIFGMLISMMILMMGVDCYIMCRNTSVESKRDAKFEYMYTYKYPSETVPDGGEACFAKSLSKEAYGYNLDVTLLGIDQNNPYFKANVKEDKSSIVISSAMAQKYRLEKGDTVVLTDKEENEKYTFHVQDVTQYATGLYAFMDCKSMRKLFHQEDGYYNVVLSNQNLTIDSNQLYSVTTKAQISKGADVFSELMKPMIRMLLSVSVIIFCIVMYLMMKVMIDRSAFHISLIKIFGYRMNEVKKLYLNGNFYLVILGAIICIPFTKWLMNKIYPFLIANVGSGMNLHADWYYYVVIFGCVIALYLVINQLLVGRLKNMVPAQVLKNRE